MGSPYAYSVLNERIDEIRLLDVQLASHLTSTSTSVRTYGNLVCHLRNISLAEDPIPSYETVSYCWGDPSPLRDILVDGSVLTIPINANRALNRLATPGRSRTLWIDAVCIDQSNAKERAQQVALMGLVFRHGTSNLIHLGEDDSMTGRALQSIQAIRHELDAGLQGRQSWEDLVWQPGNNIRFDALGALYSCQWFTRIWVVQEAILATRNVCIQGSIEFELTPLLEVTAALAVRFWETTALHLQQTNGIKGFYNASLLWQLMDSFASSSGGQGVDLDMALTMTEELDCSEPRDRVFALLGIVQTTSPQRIREAAAELLEPDYGKPVSSVYRDATRFCIIQSGRLDILNDVEHLNDAGLMTDCSWAVRYDRHPFHSPESSNSLPAISSGLSSDDFIGCWPVVRGALSHLDCYGFFLEQIAQCTPTLPSKYTGAILEEAVDNFIKCAIEIAVKSGSSITELALALVAESPKEQYQSTTQPLDVLVAVLEQVATNLSKSRNTEDVTLLSQVSNFLDRCRQRRLIATTSGVLGLVPGISQVGDIVAYLHHAGNPCVLRPASNGIYLFLGVCYINALKNDEDIEQYPKLNGRQTQSLTLC